MVVDSYHKKLLNKKKSKPVIHPNHVNDLDKFSFIEQKKPDLGFRCWQKHERTFWDDGNLDLSGGRLGYTYVKSHQAYTCVFYCV